jgi:hypothetical protein
VASEGSEGQSARVSSHVPAVEPADASPPQTEEEVQSETPVVARLSKSNIAKVLSSTAQQPGSFPRKAADDDTSSALHSAASHQSMRHSQHADEDELGHSRIHKSVSPKPARPRKVLTSNMSDVSSNLDSRASNMDGRRSNRPRHAGESGDESHSAASSISSAAPPPPGREISKVEAIRNRKTESRKNSWHGALATGWMEKETM